MIVPDLFGAFANPTRLRILNLLREREELCVCDLCAALREPQPKVSRHLAILRGAGLVEASSERKWKFYRLAPPATPLHRTLLHCLRSCLGEVDELSEDRSRLAAIGSRVRCGRATGARA